MGPARGHLHVDQVVGGRQLSVQTVVLAEGVALGGREDVRRVRAHAGHGRGDEDVGVRDGEARLADGGRGDRDHLVGLIVAVVEVGAHGDEEQSGEHEQQQGCEELSHEATSFWLWAPKRHPGKEHAFTSVKSL